MKILTLTSIFFTSFFFISACKTRDNSHDEIVKVVSSNTMIDVKISYPEKLKKKNKIILWSFPLLSDRFLPNKDLLMYEQNIWMSPILKNALLDSGYINIEYIGRNENIEFAGRTYSIFDSNTKAADLESLINFIKVNYRFKNKKIILIGHSEGGEVNAKVASNKQNEIYAILQLASSALSGIQMLEYQREKVTYPTLLSFFSMQEGVDTYNKISSLDSYHTPDLEGVKQYFNENIKPVEKIIFEFDDMDSIYYHINLYLHNRWEKEDNTVREVGYKNNFNSYYSVFAGTITPQQITAITAKPEHYYPFIKCPVLLVQGTEDIRIDCFPNAERMEQLLKDGGNFNFQKIILEGYNHKLTMEDGRVQNSFFSYFQDSGKNIVEDSIVQQIIEWIDGL